MGKQLNITHNDNEYTLEFNRRVVGLMEDKGLNIQTLFEKPVKSFPMLFAGAFHMHHKGLAQNVIDSIFDTIENKEAFLEGLIEMYGETISTVLEEPEQGNAQWEKNW